jgi:PAT family beta-lactamase induction signal transducer AmpG
LNEPEEAKTEQGVVARPSIIAILRTALVATKNNGGLGLLAVIATYKMGEAMADGMWKPFLVKQAGFTPAQLGQWVGTYGAVAAVIGSIAGGLLARRLSFASALFFAGSFRAMGIVGQWMLANAGGASKMAVIGVTIFEHFFGGMITPIMFALMMSRVDRSIGATHYTFLATLEVLGKSPTRFFSGVVATYFGYSGVFAAGAFLSFGFLALIPLVKLGRAHPQADSAT